MSIYLLCLQVLTTLPAPVVFTTWPPTPNLILFLNCPPFLNYATLFSYVVCILHIVFSPYLCSPQTCVYSLCVQCMFHSSLLLNPSFLGVLLSFVSLFNCCFLVLLSYVFHLQSSNLNTLFFLCIPFSGSSHCTCF